MNASNSITSAPLNSLGFVDWKNFLSQFRGTGTIWMVWGEVGVGKTTLALQTVKSLLDDNLKVFFLYTKKAPINRLIKRIVNQPKTDSGSPKEELAENVENLIYWEIDSYKKQEEIISQWLLQVQQLKTFFKENRVGAIIVDEIASLYLEELGSDKVNEKANDRLTFQLATLKNIAQSYGIPAIILNSFSVKKDDAGVSQAIPYGGKILDYWTDVEIKMERMPQFSKIKLVPKKKLPNVQLPESWIWTLTDTGFM